MVIAHFAAMYSFNQRLVYINESQIPPSSKYRHSFDYCRPLNRFSSLAIQDQPAQAHQPRAGDSERYRSVPGYWVTTRRATNRV